MQAAASGEEMSRLVDQEQLKLPLHIGVSNQGQQPQTPIAILCQDLDLSKIQEMPSGLFSNENMNSMVDDNTPGLSAHALRNLEWEWIEKGILKSVNTWGSLSTQIKLII